MIMDPNFIVKVLLSLIVAAALAFAVTPLVKRLAQRVGAMDVPKDERRMHKIPIPAHGRPRHLLRVPYRGAVLCRDRP